MDKLEKYLNAQYNLTLERYTAILESQGGRCAICMSKPDKFVVDHDHFCCTGPKSCGFCIRGLLCHKCNVGIGMFNDRHDVMARARKYVFNFRESRGLIRTNGNIRKDQEEILISPVTPTVVYTTAPAPYVRDDDEW